MNLFCDPFFGLDDSPGAPLCSTGIEVGAVMAAISAAMAVAGSVASSNAQQTQANYAKADAEQAMLTGQAESQRQARINQAKQAELIAGAGAQGTTMAGSPMEVYLENAKQGALEEADPLYGATLKNRSLRNQASIYNRQATNSLYTGIGEGAGKLAGGLSSSLLSPAAAPASPSPVSVSASSGGFQTAGVWDPRRYKL